jgi:hypothetical protein
MGNEKTIWLDHDEVVRAAGERVVADDTARAAFNTSPSQYDVPEAIRSYLDDQGHCVIQLKYIGPDEPLTLITADHLQVQTGKNSGRIYAFLMDKADRDHGISWDSLHQAVSTVERSHPHPRKANYRLVDFLLTRWSERLTEPTQDHAPLPAAAS